MTSTTPALVNYRNCRRLGYTRVSRGVYVKIPEPGAGEFTAQRQYFIRHVRAVCQAYGGKVLLCGPTALQVMGVALPSHLEDWRNCHIALPRSGRRPFRKHVIAHRPRTSAVWREIGDLRVVHPVDAWLQLRGVTESDMIEVGDGFLRRNNPLLSLDAMHRRLRELVGAHGIKRARRAMLWIRPDTESIYETRMRLVFVRAGLPCPEVNVSVRCRRLGRDLHVDNGYRVPKLGMEFDGIVHVGSRQQMELDAIRRNALQDEGWLIFTVTAKQLRNPRRIIDSVRQSLSSRQPVRAITRAPPGRPHHPPQQAPQK